MLFNPGEDMISARDALAKSKEWEENETQATFEKIMHAIKQKIAHSKSRGIKITRSDENHRFRIKDIKKYGDKELNRIYTKDEFDYSQEMYIEGTQLISCSKDGFKEIINELRFQGYNVTENKYEIFIDWIKPHANKVERGDRAGQLALENHGVELKQIAIQNLAMQLLEQHVAAAAGATLLGGGTPVAPMITGGMAPQTAQIGFNPSIGPNAQLAYEPQLPPFSAYQNYQAQQTAAPVEPTEITMLKAQLAAVEAQLAAQNANAQTVAAQTPAETQIETATESPVFHATAQSTSAAPVMPRVLTLPEIAAIKERAAMDARAKALSEAAQNSSAPTKKGFVKSVKNGLKNMIISALGD